ncbi:GNAT family N-acetyltransferase [Legionella brunensis]|nr:GNAT family N-acetyltransferase [Legionella brunensis]
MRIIQVVPYNPQWSLLFEQEAAQIRNALGANCFEIHHIGSTAVPGLAAKPVIDMVPVVKDIRKVDDANDAMQALGYEVKGEFGILFRRYFQKGGDLRTHNIHVFEINNPEIERHLRFRDWMRSHKEDRDTYANLKRELAKKHPDDILAYCLGKDAFITDIDTQTGFSGVRIVKALTTREWDTARSFRQIYFAKEFSISDPYIWTFEHEEHAHLVLYQGTQIIGYTHLQLSSKQRAIIRLLFINEAFRESGFGTKMLTLCEQWLQYQNVTILEVDSTKKSEVFFGKKGFIKVSDDRQDDFYDKLISPSVLFLMRQL